MAAANQDPVGLFIASIEQIKEVFVRYIPLVGDPAERRWMEETLGVLNEQQADFEATVPMSIAQTQKEAIISMIITILTTMSACQNSAQIERSACGAAAAATAAAPRRATTAPPAAR